VIILRIGLLLLLAAAAAGCATSSARHAEHAAQPVPLDRQILVMIKESSLRRYRPGAAWVPLYGESAPAHQARVAEELAAQYHLQLVSDWAMPALGVRCFLVAVPLSRSPEEVVSQLASDPRVESAQTVQTFHALGHTDPYYPLQASAAALRLDELHRMAKGRRVVIAQIDTGVELEHPDLQGQLSQAINFVDETSYAGEMHGTAVAGIIVAKADNGIGIVGVAPEATLLPLRACWQRAPEAADALCSSFTLAKAIQYALTHEARVLNLSLAGPPDRLLERLVEKAIERGMTVVGAVDPVAPGASFPASSPDVIAVAAADTPSASMRVVYAPGERVLTTTPHASFAFMSGNSFATAHVTGVVALLLESAPELKPKDIFALLRNRGSQSASGRASSLDACVLLASLSVRRDCHCCDTAVAPRAPRRTGDPPS
jgi:subtilisin family serine protease